MFWYNFQWFKLGSGSSEVKIMKIILWQDYDKLPCKISVPFDLINGLLDVELFTGNEYQVIKLVIVMYLAITNNEVRD